MAHGVHMATWSASEDHLYQDGDCVLSDYQYVGKRGTYQVKFDAHPDGVRASAAGPAALHRALGADAASVVAGSDVEADRLLLAKLQELGA